MYLVIYLLKIYSFFIINYNIAKILIYLKFKLEYNFICNDDGERKILLLIFSL